MDNENTIECESTVKIAGDVVGKIAAIAALEVEGVSAMGGNITNNVTWSQAILAAYFGLPEAEPEEPEEAEELGEGEMSFGD